MGVILMAGAAAGMILGLMVTAVLGGTGLVLTRRSAETQRRAWWCFGMVFAALLTLGLLTVNAYPYDPVRPGSDYDVALRNYFWQWFGFSAVPGPAALLAGVATRLLPKGR